jgi:ADP-ribose pyrophosphatase YjhB (NUDIX family)
MASPKSELKSSVAGVLFNHDRSEVLLIKRRDVSVWVIPGGGVDAGETPEHAIVREFKEETGLTVAIKRQVALFTPVNRLTNHSYLFECVFIEGEPTLSNETKGVGFFSLNRLPTPLFFLHEEWVKVARNPSGQIIQSPLSQITYFNLFKYFITHPIQVFRIILSRIGIPFNTD